jgi:hypothetical protein
VELKVLPETRTSVLATKIGGKQKSIEFEEAK